MPRTLPSEWPALFNFAGRGILHMEFFEDGTLKMCCEILVGGEDVFIWASDDLIYCDFES